MNRFLFFIFSQWVSRCFLTQRSNGGDLVSYFLYSSFFRLRISAKHNLSPF